MILTEEQKANIGVLVSKEAEYQETYLEVYDHMLSSLEARDALPDLQKAYRDVLEEDFGGHYGIEMLEENRRLIIREETLNNQKQMLYWFFKFPGLLLPIAFGGAYYYYLEHKVINTTSIFSGSFFLLIISSFVVMGISNFILNRKNRKQKPSINNVSIKIMWRTIWKSCLYLWVFRILCLFMYMRFTQNADYRHALRILATMIVDVATFVLALYLIAGLLVYKHEFKKRLAL
jgi:hypothetical protein